MANNRFEKNQNYPPEEKENIIASEALERVDEMVLKNIEKGVEKKLDDKSSANLLTGLKGEIIDPLYENAWLKGEAGIGQYEDKEELKGFLRKALEKHYRTFLIPGYISYDYQSRETKIAPPRGLGYETQIMLLEESGLIQNSRIEFFEIGKENQIPKEQLANGLKLCVSEAEKKKYAAAGRRNGREAREMESGPTAILYEILTKAGFFDKLEDRKKMELMGAVLFADVIERNEWLEPTVENFFDESKINFFKINRLLNHEQVLSVMSDFLKEAKINWSDFGETRKIVKEIVEQKAREPLSDEFIRKHDLESAMKKQTENIRGSRVFLKSETNVFHAELGGRSTSGVIYIKNPSTRWKNGAPGRLPGQLPAIAAEAPRDQETGEPLWKPKHAYLEVSDGSFLAYVKRENASELLGKVEHYGRRTGINFQVAHIGNWVKIFAPFRGKLPPDFEGRLENNWLKLRVNKTKKTS